MGDPTAGSWGEAAFSPTQNFDSNAPTCPGDRQRPPPWCAWLSCSLPVFRDPCKRPHKSAGPSDRESSGAPLAPGGPLGCFLTCEGHDPIFSAVSDSRFFRRVLCSWGKEQSWGHLGALDKTCGSEDSPGCESP